MSGNSRQRRKAERVYERTRISRLKLLDKKYQKLSQKDDLQSQIRIREDDIEELKTYVFHCHKEMSTLKCIILVAIALIIYGNYYMLTSNVALRFLISSVSMFNICFLCMLSVLFMLAYDKRKYRLSFQEEINKIKNQICELQNKLQIIKV